ncbi:hypothetical protein OU997_06735 [Pseudomonas sp. SL4(2022)]|uniref:hypothetical protein n=1 Tax=Pseudomonas sp. SL4(2022) TaxID=2994661 RepID=UPI00226E6B45|nr:hypothetical protein [Pseudomonas sp. SL4(2022)]WAC45850.1 hypothetical protein OU997_06735 [Pseudomonas sp. SL4(2022)]
MVLKSLLQPASLSWRGVVLAVPLGFVMALLTVLYPLPGMVLAASLGGCLLLSKQPQYLLVLFVISLAIPIQKSLAGLPLNAADGLLVVWGGSGC